MVKSPDSLEYSVSTPDFSIYYLFIPFLGGGREREKKEEKI